MAGPSRRIAGLLAAGIVVAAGLAGCDSEKRTSGRDAERIRKHSDEKHGEMDGELRDAPPPQKR